MPSLEVKLPLSSNTLLIVPVWKAPAYNSPTQNWKRGMYAVSTGVLLVLLLILTLVDGTP